MKLSLRNKLLFFSIALSMIPLGLAGRSMMRIAQDELKSSANEEISTTAESLAQEVDDLYVDTWLAPLQLVASGLDNEALGPQEKLSLVRAGIINIADVVACQISIRGAAQPILITKDDFTAHLQDSGLDPATVLPLDEQRLDELLARTTGDSFAGDLKYLEKADRWLVSVILPLKTLFAGREAFLVARVDLLRLRELIETHPFNRTGNIMMVESDGRQIFDAARTDLNELSVIEESTALIGSASRAVSVKPYTTPGGVKMLAGFAFPQNFNWAVAVEREEADAYLAVGRMFNTLMTMVLGGLAIAVLGALFFAVRISRPIEEIANVAREVEKGNLDIRVRAPKSKDEIGILAGRMNEMIKGLSERDFIRETFGRYVSPEVAQQVLSDPAGLHPGGEVRTVTVMMSDLRGFTSLSERLSPPEMVNLLNAYLGRMSDVIAEHGGTVIEFIGDAIMVLFGAPSVHDDDPQRAVACAAAMQVDLEAFNEEGTATKIPPLQMGIGINTGSVIVGNIGSEKRMKYGVVGDDVNLTARVESFTVGGEVLVSEATRNACGDIAEFRGPFEVKAKGKKEPLKMYAVVSIGAPFNVTVPAEARAAASMVSVSLGTECFKIAGKEIASTPFEGTIVQMGADDAELELSTELAVFDNVKLKIYSNGKSAKLGVNDVYAKVLSAERDNGIYRCHLRFTSVPDDDRAWIQKQIEAKG